MNESHQPLRPVRPMWMFALFAIACCIMGVTAGFFLYGMTLPDRWSVSESIVIEAPPAEVVGLIANPSAWTEWSMWSAANDPSLKTNTTGPDSGAGATMQWTGRMLGRGKLVITDVETDGASDGRTVHYELYRQGELFSDEGAFELVPEDGHTRVVWSDSGELGSTTARLFRERFTDLVARDYARSLEQLRDVVESDVKSRALETDSG